MIDIMINIITNEHQKMFAFGRYINHKFNNKIGYFIKLINIVLKISIFFRKIPKLKVNFS